MTWLAQKAGLPVTVEIGGGDWFSEVQPLGRPRPWLDEKGQMTDSMFDRQITIIAFFLLSSWFLAMAVAPRRDTPGAQPR